MTKPEAISAVQRIRKRIPKLKLDETVAIYQSAEANLQRYLIVVHGCYINSKHKVINLDTLNPKHAENVTNKYVRNVY